jgi:hypothetical protein
MARLSNRDPSHVVCDRLDCGETFGRIADVKPEQCGVLLPTGLPPGRWLVMEPDWVQDRDEYLWCKPEPHVGGARHQSVWTPPMRYVIVYLPVKALCPACGLRQYLVGAELQLAGLPKGKLELRPGTTLGSKVLMDALRPRPFRYMTGRAIGEREAAQLLT